MLVAAMMRAFLDVWTRRLEALGTIDTEFLDLQRVAEEGADVADLLLTDGDPRDRLHAADPHRVRRLPQRDDHRRQRGPRRRHPLRAAREACSTGSRATGSSRRREPTDGDVEAVRTCSSASEGVRFASLQTDPIEMFRLVWANREQLELEPTAYTRIASLRPCVRTSPDDGLPLRETVAECIQYVKLQASELAAYGLRKPPGMPDDQRDRARGRQHADPRRVRAAEVRDPQPAARRKTDEAGPRARRSSASSTCGSRGTSTRARPFAARLSTMHRLRAG